MKSNVVDLSGIKAIAMSFHGPLVDTRLMYQGARKLAFQAHGFGDIPSELHAAGQEIAATSPAVIGRVLKKAGKIPADQSLLHCETTHKVSATADQIYRNMTKQGLEPQKGSIEAVRNLASRYAGKMALVTCAERQEVSSFLEKQQLADIFPADLVITRETILDSRLDLKPAPDAYMLAMTLMDVRERKLLAIDDSPSGLTAAVDSGATVCALTNRCNEDFTSSPYVRYQAASLADIKFL